MEGPPPPRDASLRNIIDKLAEFVARNGPEFEMITKQKQQGNPKFEFLYGGEYAAYYQYRVVAEQSFLKPQKLAHHTQMMSLVPHPQLHNHHQQLLPTSTHFVGQGPPPPMNSAAASHNISQAPPPSNNNAMWSGNSNIIPPTLAVAAIQHANGAASGGNALALTMTAQIEAINQQQNGLRDQIHQSELNLAAQHSALMAQQKKQIDETMEAAQNAQLEKQAEEYDIPLKEFDTILHPIIESCTKDSISSGKNWILQHSSDSAKNNIVLQYLLKKALSKGSTFQQKLHLIYLVNDILHHCVRKNVNDLKNSLENVVIPMFCSAELIASADQHAKLTKLLSLWESKAKFFDACVISKLQSPDSSMQEYKTNLQNFHNEIVAQFTKATKSTIDNYKQQHQIFIQHATQQIAQLEQQKKQMEQQMLATVPQSQPQLINKIPSLMSQKILMPGGGGVGVDVELQMMQPPGVDDATHYCSSNGTNTSNNKIYQQQQQPTNFPPTAHFVAAAVDAMQQQQQQQQHQQQTGANFFIPDLSKPPPGFLTTAGGSPLPSALQQQYVATANVPMGPQAALTAVGDAVSNSVTVDMLTLNTALKIMQQQQQQMLLQQQQQHIQQQLLQHHQLEGTPLKQHRSDIGDNQHDSNADDELHEKPISHHQRLSPQQQSLTVSQPSAANEEVALKPTVEYYDLPAGLMVPLIRLEDYNYRPLNPAAIRLPAPAPQSERLTNALTAFYSPPTHDRPRDTEGWEKLGLYEYYKVKNAAKKQKEEELQDGLRQKSRSPSPIVVEKPKVQKVNKRCYRSESRSRSKSRSPAYRSHSRSRSRSPPPPPPPLPPPRSRSDRDGRSSAHNRNRRQHRSPMTPRDRERDRNDRDSSSSSVSRDSSRDNRFVDRSNARRERDRSLTPPLFLGHFAKPNDFIEETNKGHQMLMKMGWAGTGTGLGTKQQGIDQPISGGEVRERKDMYKGVGISLNDPFENFRKNKGAAFVHRMRARDDKS